MITVIYRKDAEIGDWIVCKGLKCLATVPCPFDALKLAGGFARETGTQVILSAADARMLAQLAIDNNS